MLGEMLQNVRENRPLVHCITNYVTANDCANLLLACGGSAIMADEMEEVEEVTSLCGGLVLNLGTPNPRKVEAMLRAGREANRMGRPVVFDPVGVGCSAFRREAGSRILEQVQLSVIRGNASEIAALTGGETGRCGVDADASAASAEKSARLLAKKTGAVVVASGATDLVTDGEALYCVHNGHPMMRTVTGTGCQLSALTGAYVAANPQNLLRAALAATCTMGLCGEIAQGRLQPEDGNAAYRDRIIDAVFHLTAEDLEKGARYELYEG